MDQVYTVAAAAAAPAPVSAPAIVPETPILYY